MTDEGERPLHVYPLGDLREHILRGFECPCGPRLTEGVIVHNAFDRRERYEVAPEKVRQS